MADIHIRKICQTEENKGRANLVYHIPIDSPKAGIIPTPTSIVATEQVEIDALANGSLIEIADDIVVSNSQTQTEIIAAIRESWQSVKVEYNKKYIFEHKFYGVILSANS